ncbi:MAG TPA: S1C family serine protease [Vicinamibacterales bacterium]
MLTEFSNQLADAAAAAAPSVVQVQGRRWRTASGVVYASGVVVTTIKALGREDGLHVRAAAGDALDAELAGWDPATGLALLKAVGLNAPAIGVAKQPPRVGHLALAIARSWSNNLTASAGIVSIIGGPLRTGRRHSIDQVIRTTAPMHDGFAGGAFIDTAGALIGIATASTIRGLGVVIPSDIAWKTARGLLEHGRVKTGYIGIAGQRVELSENQRANGRDEALLVIAVTTDGPAAKAGIMVGDVIVSFDGQAITSPDDLLDVLTGERIGTPAALGILRGGDARTVTVTVGERGAS